VLDPNVVGCHDVQHRATDTEGSVTFSLAIEERLVTFYSKVPAPQALTSPQVACAEREREMHGEWKKEDTAAPQHLNPKISQQLRMSR